ncbi:Scrb3p [Tyrophagus putrescentiae]|nr:Scrb3p [Tyrophagus putrescentiae]
MSFTQEKQPLPNSGSKSSFDDRNSDLNDRDPFYYPPPYQTPVNRPRGNVSPQFSANFSGPPRPPGPPPPLQFNPRLPGPPPPPFQPSQFRSPGSQFGFRPPPIRSTQSLQPRPSFQPPLNPRIQYSAGAPMFHSQNSLTLSSSSSSAASSYPTKPMSLNRSTGNFGVSRPGPGPGGRGSSYPLVSSAAYTTSGGYPTKKRMSIVSGLVPIESVAMTKKYEQMKDNFKQKVVDTKGGNVEYRKYQKRHVDCGAPSRRSVKRQIKKHPYIAGIIITVYSIVMFLNQNNFIRMGMSKVMNLDKNGWITKYGLFTEFAWANPPVYGRACLYFFGIKNGPAFLKGAKPHLYDVGPFCIYATRRRRIRKWKKKTLTFDESYVIGYDPRGSLPLETKWTTINLPIFLAVYSTKSIMETFYMRFFGPLVYNAIVKALQMSGEELITEMTGYQIMISYELKILKYLDMALLSLLRSLGMPIPQELGMWGFVLRNNSFGVTTTPNGGWIGPFEQWHTTEDGHMQGDIYSALHFRSYPLKEPPCDVMEGGEGYFMKRPFRDDKLTFTIFFVCRPLVIKREYTHYFYGSFVSRFKVDDDMFNYSGIPENSCHCLKENKKDCDGFAHFYKSPRQLAKVTGLNPTEEEHAAYVEMEDELGFPVFAQVALQIIVDIGPISSVPELAHIKPLQYPIAWAKVKEGVIGILGAFLFIIVTFIHYGNVLWLMLGFAVTGFLFYKASDWRNTP